ncbi:MAG: hypothetical protein KGJ73_09605 [Rhodospirillales bacterium]|nr:hypothetical protein [Rhodospirillales bacterium]
MKKAMKWGGVGAVLGAAFGILLSAADNLLCWPLTSLTPEGVLYLAGSIAVPALILFLLGFGAGFGAEKLKPAPYGK